MIGAGELQRLRRVRPVVVVDSRARDKCRGRKAVGGLCRGERVRYSPYPSLPFTVSRRLRECSNKWLHSTS